MATAKIRLADHCTVYQAELCGIKRALEMLPRRPGGSVYALASDSRAALMAIQNPDSLNPIVFKIRNILEVIRNKQGEVKFYWVKAHVQIKGNKRADELAKQAALHSKTRIEFDEIPISYIKRYIREGTLDKWQEAYDAATAGRISNIFFKDIRKAYTVIRKIGLMNNCLARLLTGHGGFGAYLCRFGLSNAPSCICDDTLEETVEHILIDCPVYAAKGWEAECAQT